MSKRRRFTADFKAGVALEALRGDKTIQEVASRHKVHPNQVGAWKKQALEGLGSVFKNGAGKAQPIKPHGTRVWPNTATRSANRAKS